MICINDIAYVRCNNIVATFYQGVNLCYVVATYAMNEHGMGYIQTNLRSVTWAYEHSSCILQHTLHFI